jgi:NADH-quinone oxidoreductase subunit J
MMEVLFYIFTITALGSGLLMLFTKRVLMAALGLLGVLLSLAGFFVLAGSEFLAVTQLMVYAGGVLIILLFGVLMLQQGARRALKKSGIYNIAAVLSTSILFIFLLQVITQINFSLLPRYTSEELAVGEGTLATIGKLLMSEYVLIFELAGLLLLIALVAAAWLAGTPPKSATR